MLSPIPKCEGPEATIAGEKRLTEIAEDVYLCAVKNEINGENKAVLVPLMDEFSAKNRVFRRFIRHG
jgi:hypothetical protein